MSFLRSSFGPHASYPAARAFYGQYTGRANPLQKALEDANEYLKAKGYSGRFEPQYKEEDDDSEELRKLNNEDKTSLSMMEAIKPDSTPDLSGKANSPGSLGNVGRSTHIRVWKEDHRKLLVIRSNMGFSNIAWVVRILLKEQAENTATPGALMKGNVPTVLTGKPLAGKTYFIKKKLLPTLVGSPVLVIDFWNEYGELRGIGYGIYGLNFKDFNEHIRFVPNKQSRIAKTEVESIFSHLDMKRDEIARWIVIVEEAHAFSAHRRQTLYICKRQDRLLCRLHM